MKIIYVLAPIFLFFSFNLNGQNPCFEFAEINVVNTSLGSPLNGPFQPNEEIEVDLVILWNGFDCNWLHGLSPSFGDGWSAASFDGNGVPEVLNPLNYNSNSMGQPGNFFWYNEGDILYKYQESPNYEFGEPVPAGWYSTATSPGINGTCPGNYLFDPNCSCGITQPCNTQFYHQMRIKLITSSQEDCDNGLTDLSIHFKLFSDFETGSGVNPLCVDIPAVSEFYQMACSIPEDLNLIPQEIDAYSGGNLEIDFTDFITEINPEVSYQWTVTGAEEISGATACNQDCGTILSQELTNSDLYETKTVTYLVNAIRSDGTAGPTSSFLVKIHPDISITTYYDNLQSVCSGVTEVFLESNAFGGAMENEDIDYLYEWNTGQSESSISVFPDITTTYELTVTDQLGTTQTSSVTIDVIPTPVVAWNSEVQHAYCIGEEYIFCVDLVQETTIFEWAVKDAEVTTQDASNCVSVIWNQVVENPFICVQYVNSEGCESNELCHDSFSFLDDIDCFLVGNEEVEMSPINIFPNPSSEWVTIEASPLEMIKITDGSGQLLWSQKLPGSTSYLLDIQTLSNGIYYLVINETEVRKLVVLR